MDYDTLKTIKQSHTTLKLLNADNMPLIISFLFNVFIEPNQRVLVYSNLESQLNDYLFHLRDIYGDHLYPKSSKSYLEDWASGENAFLRKYYTHDSDEPVFDLTPHTEKAVEWLQSLKENHFIGTESRLMTVFQLLRDIADQTTKDPQVRISELERKKQAIENEIIAIKTDGINPHDPTQIKERFFQAEETARRLLADFRQVEFNFRALDQETRELIATSNKTKGDLLKEIFQDHDIIRDSDQGRSFHAFWEFLMSYSKKEELDKLLETVFSLEEIRELNPDKFLENIKFYLLEAGEKVYKTGNLIVEQLRKYLDDQVYLENKRIMDITKNIEKQAIVIKNNPPVARTFTELDDLKPDVNMIMSRGLFTPPKNPDIQVTKLTDGKADIKVHALYKQNHVDERILRANIRKALYQQSQISLSQIVELFPIRKGLSEILAYLNLATKDDKAMIDEEYTTLYYTTEDGESKKVELPKVVFVR